MKKLIDLIWIILLLALLTSCDSHIKPGGARVMGIAISYMAKKKTIPETLEELQQFAIEEKITVDWSQFSRLDFKPQSDGSLLVEFESEKSKGSFTIRPKWEIPNNV